MLELASRAVYQASDLVWGWWTISLLLGTGLFLTVRFGVLQVTRLPRAFARMGHRGGGGEGVRGLVVIFTHLERVPEAALLRRDREEAAGG